MAVNNDSIVNIVTGENIVIPAAVRVAVLATKVSLFIIFFLIVCNINISTLSRADTSSRYKLNNLFNRCSSASQALIPVKTELIYLMRRPYHH